jgi:hypothetical protein
MIEFLLETLQLFPFLFATYFVLEAVEAQAGGALERFLERARSVGPLVGALAGAVPHCGVSAAASSLFAAGVVSAGTLLAVFLSTSDELVPVLVSARAPVALVVKVVGLKICFAIAAGFPSTEFSRFFAAAGATSTWANCAGAAIAIAMRARGCSFPRSSIPSRFSSSSRSSRAPSISRWSVSAKARSNASV